MDIEVACSLHFVKNPYFHQFIGLFLTPNLLKPLKVENVYFK